MYILLGRVLMSLRGVLMFVMIVWSYVVVVLGKEILDSCAQNVVHTIQYLFHAHFWHQMHSEETVSLYQHLLASLGRETAGRNSTVVEL